MKRLWQGLRWAILFFAAIFISAGINQTTKDALKVAHILKTIDKQSQDGEAKEHEVEVTEKELNAYIAYRIRQEKNSAIKSINLSLLENNHIKGVVRFDSKGMNLDVLLGDHLDFDFKGILYCRSGKAKIEYISLNLGGQPVNPQVLDFVLHTAALVYGTNTSDKEGWYALPGGIKRIMADKAKITLFY